MLTDLAIRKAKAGEKGYKLSDERGLHLFVSPTGAKSFRLKYRYGGVEKLLTIGRWPDVSLIRARELATTARGILTEGRDPGIAKRIDVAAQVATGGNTLEALALELHPKLLKRLAPRQHKTWLASMEREVFPTLGKLPVADITVPMLFGLLSEVEGRSKETAHRIRRRIETIFAYAIQTGRGAHNPAAELKGALTPADGHRKQPAALTLPKAREVWRAVHDYPAALETVCASKMLALTATRSNDVRGMLWSELDGIGGADPIWTVPSERLKGRISQKADGARVHVVPLSPAAVAVLEAVRPLTGHLRLVFGSPRFPDRPLSDMALSMLYKRAGFEGRHVPHGWRASFSTIMNERRPLDAAAIDATLGHVKGGVEGRYNRAEFLAKRRELLEEWARILTGEE